MVWIQQNIAEITNTRGKNKDKVDMDSFGEMDLSDTDDAEARVLDLFRGDSMELDENVYARF